MWIACVDGFFSTVLDKMEPGRMLIRARCEKDIQNLYGRYRDKCRSMRKPTSDETRDYRWRLSISKRDWVKLAAELASKSGLSKLQKRGSRPTGPGEQEWAVFGDLVNHACCAGRRRAPQQKLKGLAKVKAESI
jgi:hypothetical protein